MRPSAEDALWCQQHLTAGGGEVGHSHRRLLLGRNGRRPRMQDGIGEPPIEFPAAAAVAGHDRRLRRAVGIVRWTDNPHMELIIVPVPRPHLAEPRAVAAGTSA